MSHRGQSHLKTITRVRPVSLKPMMQHLLCIGALKGACKRRLFNRLFFGTSTALVRNHIAFLEKYFFSEHVESFLDPQNMFYTRSEVVWIYI